MGGLWNGGFCVANSEKQPTITRQRFSNPCMLSRSNGCPFSRADHFQAPIFMALHDGHVLLAHPSSHCPSSDFIHHCHCRNKASRIWHCDLFEHRWIGAVRGLLCNWLGIPSLHDLADAILENAACDRQQCGHPISYRAAFCELVEYQPFLRLAGARPSKAHHREEGGSRGRSQIATVIKRKTPSSFLDWVDEPPPCGGYRAWRRKYETVKERQLSGKPTS